MSSGDKAKPPATFEERNPFDISRRSGTDVAAEIAKRMAAWKQARARTSATPTTIPSDEAKYHGGEAKSPPIAAPVQPARMPKSTTPTPKPAPTATPAARGAGNVTPGHVPYFASSAARRAMPPAPSLTQGSARRQATMGDELAQRADEVEIPIAAPVLEQESPRPDESVAKAEMPLADATPGVASVEETPVTANAASPEPSDPVESPSVSETLDSTRPQTDDEERRRAEARAIKARWIAARDLDALIDTSGAGSAAAPRAEAAVAAAHETGSKAPAASERRLAGENVDRPLPGEMPDEASDREELILDDPAEAERGAIAESMAKAEEPATDAAADMRTAATDVSDAAAWHMEQTFAAPRVVPAPIGERDIAREAPALDLAALDEIAGRREPTFDAPVAQAASQTSDAEHKRGIVAQDDVADEPRRLAVIAAPELPALMRRDAAASAATEPAVVAEPDVVDDGLSIAALDEVAGRKEPNFDAPVQREVPAADQAREPETRTDGLAARRPFEIAPTMPADPRASEVSPHLSIAALDEAVGRKEPTFDEPMRPAKPAITPAGAPHATLRPIETRIEARRIDTLRADPQLSARRSIFPHIEPEEWDVPPMVAARAHGERRGTGWAIGLGTVLLVAGITAPAAIWQQGRQVQDQVALVNPAPAPQQAQTPAPTATATPQAPGQAALPEAPQPETKPSAPAVTAQESSGPTAAAPSPEAEQAAAKPQPATTLGAISDGGDVNEAPVVAPATPVVNLASETGSAGTGSMVARPFVPQDGSGPFLRAPTTGAASVPVASVPAQSAVAGVKPNLMVQLKPKATAAASKPVTSKPRTTARKPKPFFQQSPDQMFQTVIDTLSEGRPVNPATKPASPSNRR